MVPDGARAGRASSAAEPCGAGLPDLCEPGDPCADDADCAAGNVCNAGICDVAPLPPCGAAGARLCDPGEACLADADCTAGNVCPAGVCAAAPPVASCVDGVRNGGETGVDCGGPDCPKCPVGEACATGADCASGGCNYSGVCAAGRSCTTHYGGDTCGLGGDGGVGPAAWEDCCAKAPVAAGGAAVMLDKYQVTAGRMRAFLEDVGYDVRGFVQSARAAGKIPELPGVAGRTVLDPAWDMYLPASFAGNANPGELSGCAQRDYVGGACTPGTELPGVYTAVSRHLGAFVFQQTPLAIVGCTPGDYGTHAFRFPDGQQDDGLPEHDQDLYDTKPIQCIDYLVGQAFCVWEGGRLETLAEWQAALGPGPLPWSATSPAIPKGPGGSTYWGCRFPWVNDGDHGACALAWNAPQSIEYAAYQYSYEYPRLTATDFIVFISAPGRTGGRGPAGHADLYGNLFELTSTVTYDALPSVARHRWTGNGSWEGHAYNQAGGPITSTLLTKYGKLGLRCAYP